MTRKFFISSIIFLLPAPALFSQELRWQETRQVAPAADSTLNTAFNNTAIIAAAAANRYIVWTQHDSAMLAISYDHGQTWNSPRFIYRGNNLSKPTIAAQNSGNGKLCMVWQERLGGAKAVRVVHSDNYGATWSQPQTISAGGDNDAVSLVAGAYNAYFVAWHSQSGNTSRIFFSAYEDNWWSAPTPLDHSSAQALFPSLAASGNHLYAVWRENSTGRFRVYFAHSPDRGKNWETARNIVALDNTSDPSVAATRDGHVVVAFQQVIQIKAVASPDFGGNFSAPQSIAAQGLFARVVMNETGFTGIAFERFFDLSQGTKSNEKKQTGFAYSRNFGATFSPDTALAAFGGGLYGNATMTAPDEVTACWVQLNNAARSLIIKRGLLPTITAVQTRQSLPDHFTLASHPNPLRAAAHGAMTIRFSIPRPERVQLSVFDALGREVRTLVNGELAGGAHVASFSAEALPAGVYFFRLQAGTLFLHKKFLIE